MTARLYAFFVFNNLLVFSVFGSAWRFVAAVIAAHDQGIWQAIQDGHLFSKVMTGLCSVSTFWLTWQMQRNLGAAIDLSQAWIFFWSWVKRKCFSPTPRELIELSAPQPFPYADYYNNYLFVGTVGMCMGTLQPIILPVTAFYLAVDCVFKTYLLQYVFITKTESGGRFWRLLVNRMLFAVLFGNAVIALVVGAQGVGSINSVENGNMLYAMAPLPFLLFGFKWYCRHAFDNKLLYYSTLPYSDLEGTLHSDTPNPKRRDRVTVKYGNPAIYKKLLTPMVHAKSQHLLKEIYGHRPTANGDIFEAPNRRSTDRARPAALYYGDMFLNEMSHDHSGKETSTEDFPQIELVAESDLDFENFKKRAEFREQFGGDGELYGKPDDLISRPGTPSTLTTLTETGPYSKHRNSPSGSRVSSRTRLDEMSELEQGTRYAQGYQQASRADDRFQDVTIDVRSSATPQDTAEVLGAAGSLLPLISSHDQDGSGGASYLDRDLKDDDTSYERYRHLT